MVTFSDLYFPEIAELERELCIREDFFIEIEGDDDWSYIVKLHSLIEASVRIYVASTVHKIDK